ncbi:MAG: Crp/Fnr family transcriptional regulator [Solobacterium sp.]|nr:Crp/Fnr family transcriptional regulator [Solobacterium sp.]
MKEYQKYLETLPFWKDLSNKEKENILSFSIVQKYDKGTFIHTQDDTCLGLIYVLKGDVRVYMVSEEGKEITLYHLLKNEIDVLSASCVVNQITFDTELIAKEDSELLIIPVTILSPLKDTNIYVRSYIYEVLADRFSDVMWTIQQILFLKMDQRIATYLVDASSQDNSLSIKTTHEEIAQEINSAREVVARVMKHFQNDGLIEMKRGTITILDKKRLLQLL